MNDQLFMILLYINWILPIKNEPRYKYLKNKSILIIG